MAEEAAAAAAAIDDDDHTDEQIARICRWRHSYYPTSRAPPSRVFVSSLRSSTRLPLYDVESSSMLILLFFLFLFFLCRTEDRNEAACEQCCTTAGQTMRIAAQTRARHRGERESYSITTSRTHFSRLDDERERDSKRRETEGRRRKSVEASAVIRARPSSLRHFRYHHQPPPPPPLSLLLP